MWSQYLRLKQPVWATNRQVIRAAHRILSARGKTAKMRKTRHIWLRQMLDYHKLAKKTCQ